MSWRGMLRPPLIWRRATRAQCRETSEYASVPPVREGPTWSQACTQPGPTPFPSCASRARPRWPCFTRRSSRGSISPRSRSRSPRWPRRSWKQHRFRAPSPRPSSSCGRDVGAQFLSTSLWTCRWPPSISISMPTSRFPCRSRGCRRTRPTPFWTCSTPQSTRC